MRGSVRGSRGVVHSDDEDDEELVSSYLLAPKTLAPEDQYWDECYRKRKFLLSLAILHSGFCGGIIFGWPALILILRADNVYGESCQPYDGELDASLELRSDSTHKCQEQEVQLGVIFVAGFFAQMISHFLMGIFLDKFGPRATNVSGVAMEIAGCLLFGYSLSSGFDGYLAAFGLLGFGGPAIHMSSLHLGNLWPTRKGTIISLLNGVLGPSAFVFLAFHILHDWFGVSSALLFIGYAIFLCLVIVLSILFVPRVSIVPRKAPLVPPSYTASQQQQQQQPAPPPPPPALKDQVFTWSWLCIMLFTLVNLAAMQFYIGTGPDQLLYMGDTDSWYTVLMSLISPCGFVGTPVLGWLLDKQGLTVNSMVLLLIGAVMNGCAMVMYLPLQIVTFSLYALYRVMIFSALVAYITHNFGFTHFGTLFGLVLCCVGGFSFVQKPITQWVVYTMNGDYFWVNAGFIIARVPLVLIVLTQLRPKSK